MVLNAIIPKNVAAIIDNPAAKPSMPSKKFMALVRPTIHRTVIGTSSKVAQGNE